MTHRLTIAPGDTIELTMTGHAEPVASGKHKGEPRWSRWQAACNICKELGMATGTSWVVKSDCWGESGRPR